MTHKRTKILLVDDHVLFRQGLKLLLEQRNDLAVIGEAANGLEAIELCRIHRPDIVLMDIDMPDCNGITATEAIKKDWPLTVVFVLSATCHDEDVYHAIQAGVSGYLQKNLEPEELFHAINKVIEDRSATILDDMLSRKLFGILSQRSRLKRAKHTCEDLSTREKEVMALIQDGHTNKEIAESLCLSPSTVKDHISNIMKKLGVRNRVEIATHAFKDNTNT